MPFVEITDVRDGLNPPLRQALSVLHAELHGNRYQHSSKILSVVADVLGTEIEKVYDALVDTTWPRSELPLIDGLGIFFFPVAHPDFTVIKLSDFCVNLLVNGDDFDISRPLPVRVPYVLVNGTVGYHQSLSKLPSFTSTILSKLLNNLYILSKNLDTPTTP